MAFLVREVPQKSSDKKQFLSFEVKAITKLPGNGIAESAES